MTSVMDAGSQVRGHGPRPFTRTLIAVVALGMLAGRTVQGQRTDRLERPERPVMFEVGGGMQLLSFGWSDAAIGRVVAGVVSARWRPPGATAGLRASAWWIQRGEAKRLGYPLSMDATHRILGLTVSGDVQKKLGSNVTIAPSIGLGLAPSVHSSDDSFANPAAAPDGGVSSSGSLWTLGVALRASRVVVEQNFIGLLGADRGIPYGREYFPLTISIRF
jgi:hypothetical protein